MTLEIVSFPCGTWSPSDPRETLADGTFVIPIRPSEYFEIQYGAGASFFRDGEMHWRIGNVLEFEGRGAYFNSRAEAEQTLAIIEAIGLDGYRASLADAIAAHPDF